MSKSILTVYLISSALFGVIVFLSNPQYYAWSLFSLGILLVAYKVIAESSNKRFLITSYMALGFTSFLVGRLFFANGALNDWGVFAILTMVPCVGFVVIRIYFAEKKHRSLV